MSKHFFPSNYKPKYDLDQTIKFIQTFDDFLIKKINDKFSSQLVFFPSTRHIESFEISDLFPRNIIFDNANTDNLFSFNQNPVDFFIKKSEDFPTIKSFVSKATIFNRDSLLTNTDSIAKEVLYLYMFDHHISAIDRCFKKIANSIILLINEAFINFSEKLEDKKINKFLIKNTFDIFNKKGVEKEKYIQEYIFKNSPILLIGTPINISNETYELKLSDIEQKNYSASFYVYVPKINSKLRLFKITPIEFNEHKETEGKNFLIQFDLSNLYLYALDKVHISEVVASSWDKDFIDFIKSSNIKIM